MLGTFIALALYAALLLLVYYSIDKPYEPRPLSVPDHSRAHEEPIAWEVERGLREDEVGVPPIFVATYTTQRQAQIEAQMASNAEDKLLGRTPYFSVRPVYEDRE